MTDDAVAGGDFPIVDIAPEWVLDEEPMGSKDKFWIERPDDRLPWLFKYSRPSGGAVTGEHWSEKLACEVAAILGVPHARVELARFEGAWGSLSRMFDDLADKQVELVHGNELLAGLLPAYDPERRFGQRQHTLENILKAVQAAIEGDKLRLDEAYRGIGGFVVLDALILNTDRHHENWALFRRTIGDGSRVEHWLAPSFDHASSLGRELQVAKLLEWRHEPWRIQWYAKRGSGAVFRRESGERGANPLRLAELALRHWPEFIGPWLERLALVGADGVKAPLAKLPEDCISEEQRQFAGDLLSYTFSELTRFR